MTLKPRREDGRDPVPSRRRSRVAMQQQERRALPPYRTKTDASLVRTVLVANLEHEMALPL